MFVKEFGKTSARDLNEQLKKVYRWQLDLDKINESDAQRMMASLGNKIKNIRSSGDAHFAEKNPEFMEAIMVSRILENWKKELEVSNRRDLTERSLTPGEMKKREKYVKGMKKVRGNFEKKYPGRGSDVMYATATKMAKESTTESAMRLLKYVLVEGDVDQARVTMAARDLADSVQDMVSKISEMQNEKLPSLITAMKDEVGIDQATSFNQSASQALRTFLDAANAARDALDNASRGVYDSGTMPGIGGDDMSMDTDLTAMPDMGAGSELDATDAATGGTAELGRGKRI